MQKQTRCLQNIVWKPCKFRKLLCKLLTRVKQCVKYFDTCFLFQTNSVTGWEWGRTWPGTLPRAPWGSSTWPSWSVTGSDKSGSGIRKEWSNLGEWLQFVRLRYGDRLATLARPASRDKNCICKNFTLSLELIVRSTGENYSIPWWLY